MIEAFRGRMVQKRCGVLFDEGVDEGGGEGGLGYLTRTLSSTHVGVNR